MQLRFEDTGSRFCVHIDKFDEDCRGIGRLAEFGGSVIWSEATPEVRLEEELIFINGRERNRDTECFYAGTCGKDYRKLKARLKLASNFHGAFSSAKTS
jgi:hypothetical protein